MTMKICTMTETEDSHDQKLIPIFMIIIVAIFLFRASSTF